MFKPFLLGSLMVFGTFTPAFAQPQCLHGPNESAAERERREHAIRVARQINELEAAVIVANPRSPQYARPSQLKLPEMPNDFDLLFLTDGKRYTFSLKDAKDPCYFAIHSDHDGLIYATMPEPETERPR